MDKHKYILSHNPISFVSFKLLTMSVVLVVLVIYLQAIKTIYLLLLCFQSATNIVQREYCVLKNTILAQNGVSTIFIVLLKHDSLQIIKLHSGTQRYKNLLWAPIIELREKLQKKSIECQQLKILMINQIISSLK